jgi:hypothetical protein
MKYFTLRNIDKIQLGCSPQEENGFDYDYDEDYEDIGDIDYSETGIINIDTVISNLNELKERGANYVSIDWHGDHREMEIFGFSYKSSTDEEIKELEKKLLNLKKAL